MIALICAVSGAAMFYLSQGVNDVWWLAWTAPIPLLWLTYGETPRWQVFAASLAAFAAGYIYMIQVYGTQLLIPSLAMMLGMGAAFGGAVLFARRVGRALPPGATLVAFPALWTAIEYAVALVSPHGSWGALAYSQVSFPAAIQTAALLGLYAVTFLICLFANAIALLARGAREAGAGGLALCALALVFGIFQLAAPQTSGVKVAALGDEGRNYAKAYKTGDKDAALAVTRGYADAVRAEAAEGTHVFVTPEGGVLASPDVRAETLAPLIEAARDTRSLIVTGALSRKPDRNMALAFTPDGQVRAYDKRHPLMPLEARFTPGTKPGLLGQGRAMAICKDMDFPRMLRDDARSGDIRLMLVPASDFMGDDWIHARMAVMRGVENGFALVRSAFNGLETISDAQGRVIAKARIDRPGLVVTRATAELGSGPTLYTMIGDVFAWGCAALALLLGLSAARSARSGRVAA
jgi:apolipoprotein N-acyltransferase